MESAQNIPILVDEARRGNHQAMHSLYNSFSKAMYNICVRMTGNSDDTHDILQESFVQAFQQLHQLKENHLFGAWLKRIVVNACIKYSKKKLPLHELDDLVQHTLHDEDTTAWWHEIDMRMVHQQIKQLPNGCREVFNLFVLEDFSHRQIAESLGISESTSKSQYHRARQILKQKITQQLQQHG